MASKRELCTRGHRLAETRKFHPNGDSYCSACKKIRYDTFRKANPKRVAAYYKASRVRKSYGLELEQVTELLEKQNGCCALCKTDIPGGHGWNIDHDHRTGKVRGLLCHGCNTGIGLLKEDKELLLRAVDYLDRG